MSATQEQERNQSSPDPKEIEEARRWLQAKLQEQAPIDSRVSPVHFSGQVFIPIGSTQESDRSK